MIIALQTLVFFRESLLTALNRLLSPYYKRLRGTFSLYSAEDEEEDEEVFAEYDEEKGVVFYPPMYAQRYAAVSDCLMDERWCGKLVKVVDLGYHDMSFIKYLKDLPGVECILGVDIESIPLRCSSDLLDCGDYGGKRENPLQVTLYQGNAADPDYRLIGCDAVVAIEMIEHMLPHDLDRLVHTIFGFIKPWVVIITTPNADFNELFKSLEKNGLRRWDHFFEWTREQFHDWCSNIVSRYPQFTVTCQGIGPGPPGTEHHGCCSQLALFVNKNYVKQQDLNLNSLAMVSNVPSPQNLAELVDGFESPITEDLRPKQNVESLTDFLYSNKQSCVTLILSSPAFSLTNIEYKDKTSQCNLDTEVGKNFLMFNDEDMYYTMLVPRRKVDHRVYEIEDVASRLNCTTFQARKFSKTTQNLMAKNRIDSLAHTREVVGEIRNLTHMLNFNRDSLTQREDGLIWCNINWGENAPYWNQYFKVVRDYNYPFEQKSEECRILELISDEINQLIDMHYEDECTSHESKLEIPIEFLMKAVRHITNDVEKVKDLLEWNGYTVAGNFVIHSRMIMDSISAGSSEIEWLEHDTTSELDTIEVQSTTASDRSHLVPDNHGRCLRRALDKKVKALRSLLSADEDITSELDRVVCKLMKLALRTSKGKQEPPPARWMQFKLLDLLTLAEKAISRRRKYYIESYPSKVTGFDRNIKTLNKMMREDRAAKMIVDKYNHLIQDNGQKIFDDLHFGFEDELGEQFGSNEFLKDYSPKSYVVSVNNGEVSLVNENLELVPYADHTASDQASSKGARQKYVRSPTGSFVIDENDNKTRKRPYSKIANDKPKPDDNNSKRKKSKTNVGRKTIRAKISSHSFLKINGKKVANDYKTYSSKSRSIKVLKKLQPSASKPIPGSLIELCHPEVNLLQHSKNFQYSASKRYKDYDSIKDQKKIEEATYVAATEESVLIDIVMDDMEETIALRRSIGTDPDLSSEEVEQEGILSNLVNEINNYGSYDKLQESSDNVHSQTIFLFDINEPSTSKGVRHISMDVQCGTDTVLSPSGLVTPPTSVTRLPKLYSTGIRIDSVTNLVTEKKTMDFGTCTNNDTQACGSACKSSSIFAKGIIIKDSRDNVVNRMSDCNTLTTTMPLERKCSPVTRSSRIRTRDSCVDMGAKNPSNFGMSTHDGTEKCGDLSPGSVFRISSGAMTDVMNSEARSANSISELLSNNDEITSITPGTKSPDMFTNLHSNGSLANLLINFNAKTDYQQNTCRFHDARCPSPEPKRRPSRKAFCKPRTTGIRIRDSSTDTQNRNNVDHGTSIDDVKTNRDTSNTASPIVYTSVKMIDFVNEVTIEQESEVMPLSHFASSTPCKLLNSRYIPEKPHEFRFKLKNSLYIKNQPRDMDTCTNINSEEFINKEDLKAQTSSKTETHMPDDQISSPGNEREDHNYMFCKTLNSSGSFTKVSLPKQTVIVQNDTEDAANKCLFSTKGFGFKVKNSDDNVIKKVEFSTTHVELLSGTPHIWTTSQLESSNTEILNSVSSKIKLEESASEFYGSNYCSSPKSLWQGTISSVNTSESKIIKQSLYNAEINSPEKTSLTKIPQKKLSCGGVHIHSFREKQVSEDIVYQGEWKRNVPKFLKNQYNGNTVLAKKVSEQVKRIKIRRDFIKEKLQIKKIETRYEIKNESKKPLRVRNTKPIKAKQEVNNKSEQIKKVTLPNLAKVIRASNKSLTKATSKTMPSTITSKNIRSMRSAKKPSNCVKLTQFVKNDCGVKSEPIRREHIDYLPPYLRRRLFASSEIKLNKSTDSNKTAILKGNDNMKEDLHLLKRSNTELIKTDLTKLQDEPRSNINYMVFRNDIENTNPPANTSQSADITNRNETTNRRRGIHRHSSSPTSQASSTCSTSDSITTVRVTNNWNRASRRHSTSSNKSSLVNTDSETSPSANKNRKFSKKCKIIKKSDGKDHSNKENMPESSNTCYPEKGMCLQNIKSAFMGRNKNVFMAKFEDSGLALNDKHQTSTKSNIKILAIESNEDKMKTRNIFKKKSLHLNDSSSKEENIRNQDSIRSEPSNLVLLIEPLLKENNKIQENKSQLIVPEEPVLKVVDSNLLTEWLECGNNSAIDKENTEKAILAQMRQLVEERLDFISNTLNDTSFDDNLSLKSYRTIVPAGDIDLDNTLKSEIENAMNHSLDAVLGDESDFSLQNASVTDADLISFKSVTSTSRYSEYYLAENDTSKIAHPSENKIASSVLDIFERKDLTPRVQHTPGTLAAQAFSGFSMDGGRIMGDQLDYMNAVDSEIGVEVTRQATSEEMFVSGRSSETYESCVVEEEVAVPDWLFHVMNPQLVIDHRPDPVANFDSETGSPSRGYARLRPPPIDEEEDQQELIPLRMPLVEPVFDANGNVVEPGIGLGAGAGDGRGMHSDHSQDSSGRGSSLSSTDASSGPQSEAILIDPSAFTTQFELFHESVGSSMAVTTLVVPVGSHEAARQGRHEATMVSTSRNVTLRPAPMLLTSDGEADVSSIDTDDIPDSS